MPFPGAPPPFRERRITAAWESELLRVIEIDPHARWAGDRELDHRTTRGLHDYVCKRSTWTRSAQGRREAGLRGKREAR